MMPAMKDIKGIGIKTAEVLAEHGLTTPSLLADASIVKIASVPGFSENRALAMKEAAKALVNGKTEKDSENVAEKDLVEEQASTPVDIEMKGKKKDKNKGKKKNKKKDKKKGK